MNRQAYTSALLQRIWGHYLTAHGTQCSLEAAKRWLDTSASRIMAKWWGLSIGPNVRFYGVPLFRRIPGSRISIGGHCQFRSAHWSNLAGLNRACVIATLSSDAVLAIGNNSGFSGTVIAAATEITIGSNVLCGVNTTITDTDWHAIGRHERNAGAPGKTSPVHIEDGVFIGMNATILKGVTIGEGAIVAAGAVVTGNVAAYTLVAGNPARVLRRLLE